MDIICDEKNLFTSMFEESPILSQINKRNFIFHAQQSNNVDGARKKCVYKVSEEKSLENTFFFQFQCCRLVMLSLGEKFLVEKYSIEEIFKKYFVSEFFFFFPLVRVPLFVYVWPKYIGIDASRHDEQK